jgi:hypothetical protein
MIDREGRCLPDPAREVDHRGRGAAMVLLVLLVGLAALVEWRVATARKRRVDLDVVLHAAWAVKTGASPYGVTNERGWHYNLPPLLAILLTPLAEPPPGEAHPDTVPFLAALAIWNALSIVCLAAGAYRLVRALAEDESTVSRRWWLLGVVPIVVCLPAIGITLNRGQVNLVLTGLLCASSAAVIRGQRFQAGWWLAVAACIKIIPAFLFVYPLWKRDSRFLAGGAVGLAVGLVVVPALVCGPARTAEHYQELGRAVLGPALSLGGDQSRADELIDLYASNSQSFQVLFHKLFHGAETRHPSRPSTALTLAHWLTGALLTLATLRVGNGENDSAAAMVIRLGALGMLMVALSPASHDHYFCMNLVLVMGIVATAARTGVSRPGGWLLALILLVYTAACALPMLPELRVLRDIRSPLIGSLALWATGVAMLHRERGQTRREDSSRSTPGGGADLGREVCENAVEAGGCGGIHRLGSDCLTGVVVGLRER